MVMKLTVEVSPETAEKIQAAPDPGAAVEEAWREKEYRDWQRSRLTPEIESILAGAIEEAEGLHTKSRDEIFDELEEVADRIHRRICH